MRSSRRPPRAGDYVRIQFGPRVVEGTVTSVRGNYMHVSVRLDSADDTIDRFVRTDSMVLAEPPGPSSRSVFVVDAMDSQR